MQQGRAFGLLDGGRGFAAALIGTVAVAVLSEILPEDASTADLEEKTEALRTVILFVSAFVFLVGLMVRFTLPNEHSDSATIAGPRFSWSQLMDVLKLKAVWFQAIIIVCAYAGYKVSDDFSLLAQDLLGYGPVESARVGTLALWLRPVAAIGAGLLADRLNVSKMMIASFSLMLVGGLIIGTGLANGAVVWIVFMAIVSSCLGMFAMRGLYFAIMEEVRIPFPITGTAVGVASIVGYTPDIFMGPLMGTLLDSSPGVVGHQHVFFLLSGFAGVGLMVSMYVGLTKRRDPLA